MNLDNIVQCNKGRSPWEPNAACRGLDVWHVVDVPTVGTFDLDGHRVLFSAVGDVDEAITLWGYVPLLQAEPESFDDVEAMFEYVDSAFTSREVLIAVADDFELVTWGRECEGTLRSSANRYIQNWVATLRREASEEDQIDAFRAGAESYSHSRKQELVGSS